MLDLEERETLWRKERRIANHIGIWKNSQLMADCSFEAWDFLFHPGWSPYLGPRARMKFMPLKIFGTTTVPHHIEQAIALQLQNWRIVIRNGKLVEGSPFKGQIYLTRLVLGTMWWWQRLYHCVPQEADRGLRLFRPAELEDYVREYECQAQGCGWGETTVPVTPKGTSGRPTHGSTVSGDRRN